MKNTRGKKRKGIGGGGGSILNGRFNVEHVRLVCCFFLAWLEEKPNRQG